MTQPNKDYSHDDELEDCADEVSMAGPQQALGDSVSTGRVPLQGSRVPTDDPAPRSFTDHHPDCCCRSCCRPTEDRRTHHADIYQRDGAEWPSKDRPFVQVKQDKNYGKFQNPNRRSSKSKRKRLQTIEQTQAEEFARSDGMQASEGWTHGESRRDVGKSRREWLTWFYFPQGIKAALRSKPLVAIPSTAKERRRLEKRQAKERTKTIALGLYCTGKTYGEVAAVPGMPSKRTIKSIVKEAEMQMHPVMAQLVRDVAAIKENQEKLLQWVEDYPDEAKEAYSNIYQDDQEITSAVADFHRLH